MYPGDAHNPLGSMSFCNKSFVSPSITFFTRQLIENGCGLIPLMAVVYESGVSK